MSRQLIFLLQALWPLYVDVGLVWMVLQSDFNFHFDGVAMAGWSALIIGVGFASGWISCRQIANLVHGTAERQ